MGLFTRKLIVFAATDYFIVPGPVHHQAACKKVARKHRWKLPMEPGERRGPLLAVLQTEPTNEHDRNAITVTIDGVHVGYVPADETARFHRQLAGTKASAGTAEAFLYRGQHGQWRVRVHA